MNINTRRQKRKRHGGKGIDKISYRPRVGMGGRGREGNPFCLTNFQSPWILIPEDKDMLCLSTVGMVRDVCIHLSCD